MPKTIGIYKISSPTGRIYIGQSTDIYLRWNKYLKLECTEQPRIFRSLKKHGPYSHKFEIIEECASIDLDIREIFWGEYYKVLGKNGLNCRIGSGKGALCDETKNKMSKARLGKPLSQSTKDKMSVSHSGNQYKLGFKVSQKTKDKISSNARQIICIETGCVFKNTKHVSKEMNINHAFIWKVCKGIKSKAKGYTFKFFT